MFPAPRTYVPDRVNHSWGIATLSAHYSHSSGTIAEGFFDCHPLSFFDSRRIRVDAPRSVDLREMSLGSPLHLREISLTHIIFLFPFYFFFVPFFRCCCYPHCLFSPSSWPLLTLFLPSSCPRQLPMAVFQVLFAPSSPPKLRLCYA